MTDDTPRMPERIWADRSEDDLPQYADTPFGIWWHNARDGYAEYIRADLYEAERQRAKKAEAALRLCADALDVAHSEVRHSDAVQAALRQDKGDDG